MKKIFLMTFALLTLCACDREDDNPEAPTANEVSERYFTITNGDPQYTFTYMGGLPVKPSETTRKITLYGDVSDYTIIWRTDPSKSGVKQVLHIDMTGKPNGITENYTVHYE